MNSTSSSRTESSSAGSYHDGLDQVEARLWERARRNLRLLYNGSHLTPSASQTANTASGPLSVGNPKI